LGFFCGRAAPENAHPKTRFPRQPSPKTPPPPKKPTPPYRSCLLARRAAYMPSATPSMLQGLTRMAPDREGEQPTNSGGVGRGSGRAGFGGVGRCRGRCGVGGFGKGGGELSGSLRREGKDCHGSDRCRPCWQRRRGPPDGARTAPPTKTAPPCPPRPHLTPRACSPAPPARRRGPACGVLGIELGGVWSHPPPAARSRIDNTSSHAPMSNPLMTKPPPLTM
jgi:hypothetical protein